MSKNALGQGDSKSLDMQFNSMVHAFVFMSSYLRNWVECAMRFPFYYIIPWATKVIMKMTAITKQVCFWQVARGCTKLEYQ